MINLTGTWIKRFNQIARVISTWSKDPSTQVGAVIIDPQTKTIVSEGYNGFPRGIADDGRLANRPEKYKLIVHAEANAILNALYNGRSVRGCAIFVHGLPVCCECAKLVIQSGIKYVVYDMPCTDSWKESTETALAMFKEAGIEVIFKKSDD